MIPPQVSHQHHYLPQFYLRQWTTPPDSKLWQYKREPSGRLSERRVAPRGTGYRNHLYSVEPGAQFLRHEASDIVEKKFMAPLDDAAAIVLKKLIAPNLQPLPDSDRRTWAIFLNSLLERGWRTLHERDLAAPAIAEQVLAKNRQRCRTAASRAGFEDLVRRANFDAMARNAIREHMVNEIGDKRVIDYLLSLSWHVLGNLEAPFITSDSPLVINCGRNKAPIETLAIALNPTRLLFMHPKSLELDGEFARALTLSHNLELVSSDAEYLYSLGKLEDGPVVKLRFAAESMFHRPSRSPNRE